MPRIKEITEFDFSILDIILSGELDKWWPPPEIMRELGIDPRKINSKDRRHVYNSLDKMVSMGIIIEKKKLGRYRYFKGALPDIFKIGEKVSILVRDTIMETIVTIISEIENGQFKNDPSYLVKLENRIKWEIKEYHTILEIIEILQPDHPVLESKDEMIEIDPELELAMFHLMPKEDQERLTIRK